MSSELILVLGEENRSYKREKEVARQEMQRLEEEVGDLKELVGHAQEELSEAQQEKADVASELEEAKGYIVHLCQQLEALREEEQQAWRTHVAEADAAKAEAHDLRGQLAAAKQTLRAMHEQKQHLQHHTKEIQQQHRQSLERELSQAAAAAVSSSSSSARVASQMDEVARLMSDVAATQVHLQARLEAKLTTSPTPTLSIEDHKEEEEEEEEEDEAAATVHAPCPLAAQAQALLVRVVSAGSVTAAQQEIGDLHEVLEELGEAEADLGEYVEVMGRYEKKLRGIQQQVGGLVQEHVACAARAQEVETTLREENIALRSKVHRLQEALASSSSSSSPVPYEKEEGEVEGRMALEVREAVTARKWTLLQQQFATETAAKRGLEQDLAEAEGHWRRRVAHLEGIKKKAYGQLKLYRQQLQASVPVAEYEAVCSELVALKEVLASQAVGGKTAGVFPPPPSSPPRQQHQQHQQAAAAWAEEKLALEADLARYHGLLEATKEEVQALKALHKEEEEEEDGVVQGLQEQLLVYQTRSDGALAVAQLQEEVNALQTALRTLTRKHEIARSSLRRQDGCIKALEEEVVEREEAAREAEAEARAQLALLRRTVQELAVVGLWKGGGGKTTSVLEKEEEESSTSSFCLRLGALSASLAELVRSVEGKQDEVAGLEAAIEALRVDKESLVAQCQDLQKVVSGRGEQRQSMRSVSSLGSGSVTSGGEEDGGGLERELAGRLLSVSEELKTTKLDLLHAKREVKALQEEKEKATAASCCDMSLSFLSEDCGGSESGSCCSEGEQVALVKRLLQAIVSADSTFTTSKKEGRGGGKGGSTDETRRVNALVETLQEYLDAVHFYETQANRLGSALWQFTPATRQRAQEAMTGTFSSSSSSCSIGVQTPPLPPVPSSRRLEEELHCAHEELEVSLEEQRRMKEDMIALAQQLQQAEERLLAALQANKRYVAASMGGGGGEEEEVAALQEALAEKEEELAELKEAIWRLKEECTQALRQQQQEEEEEEEEEAAAATAPPPTRKSSSSMPRKRKGGASPDQLEKRGEGEAVEGLQHQMCLLQQRLAQARVHLGNARKDKEKAEAGQQAALVESKGLGEKVHRMESDLIRLRAELAKARKAAAGGGGGSSSGSRIEELEKQVRLLTTTILEHQQQRQAAAAAGRPTTPAAGGNNRPAEKKRRTVGGEEEEEAVASRKREIAALKATLLRLQGENEGLRVGLVKKTAAELVPSGKVVELERRLKEAKQQITLLAEEKTALKSQLASAGEMGEKLSKREESLAQLRGTLRAKEDALATWKQRHEAVEGEKETLQREIKGLRHRLQALEKELAGLRGHKRRRSSSSSSSSSTAAQQEEEQQPQQQQPEDDDPNNPVDAEEDPLEVSFSLSSSTCSSSSATSPEDVIAALQAELTHCRIVVGRAQAERRRLSEENGKLMYELSAFDLNFWEELEDLKYAHQEDQKRIEEARQRVEKAERQLALLPAAAVVGGGEGGGGGRGGIV